ncbi:MAG: Beta-lactamase family protein [candidate division TM6 bacterium GW2011_GWF2_32_72]|nr:MAG: Beta-lactamase family protein [candidate division TM6 bacterium GW2011_GWF2_32_72]
MGVNFGLNLYHNLLTTHILRSHNSFMKNNNFKWLNPFFDGSKFKSFKKEVEEKRVLCKTLWMKLRSFIRNYFTDYREFECKWVENNCNIPESSKSLKITWIGHSTFLIQIAEKNILVDPIFFRPSIIFRRNFPPGISLEKLPQIHVVLISHNHRDHMDAKSLKFIVKRFPGVKIMVPFGDKKNLQYYGLDGHEFQWWQEMQDDFVKFTFLPAKHWSQHWLLDKKKSLWGSWMISVNDKNVYFGGDTSYSSHFVEIGKKFDGIDIALLPIGPCEPRSWLMENHLAGDKVIDALCEINAKCLIPMHWATFNFGEDYLEQPIEELDKAWLSCVDKTKNISLHFVKMGKIYFFEDV